MGEALITRRGGGSEGFAPIVLSKTGTFWANDNGTEKWPSTSGTRTISDYGPSLIKKNFKKCNGAIVVAIIASKNMTIYIPYGKTVTVTPKAGVTVDFTIEDETNTWVVRATIVNTVDFTYWDTFAFVSFDLEE